jgi:2-methylisocitrate lyase-like PEP mutase family enzyme
LQGVFRGADCVYPFGLSDPKTIGALVKAVDAPVKITGRPGMPNAAALQRLGVARITIASAHHLGGRGRDPEACVRIP